MINSEKRICQPVLQKDARRGDSVLLICSWCKKIDIRDGNWQEIEDAVKNLKLFESGNLPQLSHGRCLSCYQSISEKYQNTFARKAA